MILCLIKVFLQPAALLKKISQFGYNGSSNGNSGLAGLVQSRKEEGGKDYRPSAALAAAPISAGFRTTRTPAASSAVIFSAAVPLPPVMIAPALLEQ